MALPRFRVPCSGVRIEHSGSIAQIPFSGHDMEKFRKYKSAGQWNWPDGSWRQDLVGLCPRLRQSSNGFVKRCDGHIFTAQRGQNHLRAVADLDNIHCWPLQEGIAQVSECRRPTTNGRDDFAHIRIVTVKVVQLTDGIDGLRAVTSWGRNFLTSDFFPAKVLYVETNAMVKESSMTSRLPFGSSVAPSSSSLPSSFAPLIAPAATPTMRIASPLFGSNGLPASLKALQRTVFVPKSAKSIPANFAYGNCDSGSILVLKIFRIRTRQLRRHLRLVVTVQTLIHCSSGCPRRRRTL